MTCSTTSLKCHHPQLTVPHSIHHESRKCLTYLLSGQANGGIFSIEVLIAWVQFVSNWQEPTMSQFLHKNELGSQHLHSTTQVPITLAVMDSTSFSGLSGHLQVHPWTHTYRSMHNKIIKINLKNINLYWS